MINLVLCTLLASTTAHLSNVRVDPGLRIINRAKTPVMVYKCPNKAITQAATQAPTSKRTVNAIR